MKNRMKTQGLQTLPRELSRSLRVQKRSQWLLFVIVSLIVVSFLSTLQICMKLHALLPPFPKNDTNALISHGQHRSSAVPDGPRWSSMVLDGPLRIRSLLQAESLVLGYRLSNALHRYCVGRVGLPTLPSCNATLDNVLDILD